MQNLFEADSTLGTTPPPDTPQDSNGSNSGAGEKMLPESEVKRIAAKEARDAKAKADKTWLESLGVSSLDEVKSLLDAKRQKDESEKSETQKLADEMARLRLELDTERASKLALETARREDKRDSELKALLSKAHDSNQALRELKATQGNRLNELLDDNGAFDTTTAQTLVSDFQKANPHLFRDTSPGSSMSNRDGRAPEVNKDAKKALENMTAKSLKGF
jgi:hypothetical protein